MSLASFPDSRKACVARPLQVHGVPQHNGPRHQIQAAGAISLLFKAPVPEFAQPVNEGS